MCKKAPLISVHIETKNNFESQRLFSSEAIILYFALLALLICFILSSVNHAF